MNLGIDISQIVYKGTGVSRFTEGLVDAILTYDFENRWIFFFSGLRQKPKEKLLQKIHSKKQKLIQWNLPPTALSLLWNDIHFVKPSFTKKLDWFITSDWTEPATFSKKATIVHDLVFKKYPQTVHSKIIKNQTKRLHWAVRESDMIFADSLSTKDDLLEIYNVNENKVCINYPGVSVSSKDLDKQERLAVLKKYNLDGSFMLTVGKVEPRKNIKMLVEAYNSLREEENLPDLVIVGLQGWDSEVSQNENIHYIGYVTDYELAALYQSALCFIFPSIYEGFGYPVIEAMAYGCPVATSNTSSLAEISGNDSALTFNPFNKMEISEAILALIKDRSLRLSLIEKGMARSEEFTWKRYLDTLLTQLKKRV